MSEPPSPGNRLHEPSRRVWQASSGQRYLVELRSNAQAMGVGQVDPSSAPPKPVRWSVRFHEFPHGVTLPPVAVEEEMDLRELADEEIEGMLGEAVVK